MRQIIYSSLVLTQSLQLETDMKSSDLALQTLIQI